MTTIDAAYTHAYRRPDARPPPPAYAIPAAAMDSDGSLERAPDAFLLAFEPLLDKYATLLARGGPRLHRAADLPPLQWCVAGRGRTSLSTTLDTRLPPGFVCPVTEAP